MYIYYYVKYRKAPHVLTYTWEYALYQMFYYKFLFFVFVIMTSLLFLLQLFCFDLCNK